MFCLPAHERCVICVYGELIFPAVDPSVIEMWSSTVTTYILFLLINIDFSDGATW